MGQSKNLYIAHREEKLATMNRKDLSNEAEQYAMLLMENKQPEEVLAQTLRVETFVTSLNKSLKAEITEAVSFGGVEYSEGQNLTRHQESFWQCIIG